MMKYITILLTACLLVACETKPKEWTYLKTIKLEGVNPIGIADKGGELWLSDGDHNRLVQLNDEGEIIRTIDSLDRPMHIDADERYLFVAEYGNDRVSNLYEDISQKNGFKQTPFWVGIKDSLDAPASVSFYDAELAIADFYNNRILYDDGVDWISFGKEGNAKGEFYYPTDVQITDSLIWVADAYNNRIQIFDKKGNFKKQIGQGQKMNAATGLFVDKTEVFVTDFENNRVLIFDYDGMLKQELKEGIAKATDLLIKDNMLHIINYRSGELVLYDLQSIKE
ncbi:NHL repeat-containing protein [uncultured Croceitalea sp.]|uniref:NHL repeat-containing protein n=1 Tax=uncultured Croceitalea sp. TaxID=1798908 RepID=UPI00374EF8DF